jgi:hypothetical protein
LFKIIPVKKQGKYNLNVQLQDLGKNKTGIGLVWSCSTALAGIAIDAECRL